MDKIEEILTRGVEKIYPSKKALEKVLRSDKKLRLYQGFDPSMPNLHLGNLVGILKLKEFQDLGHEVIFLIGDFTGMIGDPTEKSAVRPRLTRKQVLDNSKTWKRQVGKILNFSGPNAAKMMFNSHWSDKITFKDLIEISANFTVQQMIERDFFQTRLREGKPIFLHEFLYPLAQAIDSVKMAVDLEIGGNDQTFNMLCGRTLMKATKGKEKLILTTKLLVDSKGQKVGKTTGNALFLNAAPADMYGGIMSFPDEVIVLGFELLTDIPLSKVRKISETLKKGTTNPMKIKKELALEIVKMLYSKKEAEEAQTKFEKIFQKKELPAEISTYEVKRGQLLVDILTESELANSRSEAKRLIQQGSVRISDLPVTNREFKVGAQNDGTVIRIGKRRFLKLRIS
ncbi:MAG TPA: tyrosine--tRNA ligase [Candidatus Bathyarchaeia archaeon]|nr:tyrosine--tRNA ligase [Candidatus Bathyarchaeia archaeon]